MYHVELRMGLNVVRVFNQTADELYAKFLVRLVTGETFNFEGHKWVPREMRIMVYEGPRLEPHRLTMGRGWPNARKTGTDVTKQQLERARARAGVNAGSAAATATDTVAAAAAVATDATIDPLGAAVAAPATGAAAAGAELPALRERLIGRLSAGPVALVDVVRLAAGTGARPRPAAALAAAEAVVEELLGRGDAVLESGGVVVADRAQQLAVLGAIDSWLRDDGVLRLAAAER